MKTIYLSIFTCHNSMQLEITLNNTCLYFDYTAWECAKTISTERTHNNSRMLELRVGAYKAVIPCSFWSPTRDCQVMISWSHWKNWCPISIDIMSAIIVDFPDLKQDPRPSTNILRNVMYIERVLNCCNTKICLGLKCLKFGGPRNKLPIITRDELHFNIEWWLLVFFVVDNTPQTPTDV